jgi:Bacterial dnaA protein helix-turn-helix
MIDQAPTPLNYAKQLAGYISDPSKVRAMTVNYWGRGPSVDQCRNLIEARRQPVRRARCQERFGRNFKCSHPQTEENTIITIDGIDTCKTCAKLKSSVKERERERAAAIMRAQREKNAKLEKARAEYIKALAEPAQPTRPLFPREVIADVERLFMLEPGSVVGGNRLARYVEARATAAYILHSRGLSYPHVGRIMNRDHSTIINLIAKIDIYKARNPMVEHVLGIVS